MLGYVIISHENLQNINCNVIMLVHSISFHRLTCTIVTESATLCRLRHLELENKFQLLFCWIQFSRMPKSNSGCGYSCSHGRQFWNFVISVAATGNRDIVPSFLYCILCPAQKGPADKPTSYNLSDGNRTVITRCGVLTAVLVKIQVFLSGFDLCRLRNDTTSRLRRLFSSLFCLSCFPAFPLSSSR